MFFVLLHCNTKNTMSHKGHNKTSTYPDLSFRNKLGTCYSNNSLFAPANEFINLEYLNNLPVHTPRTVDFSNKYIYRAKTIYMKYPFILIIFILIANASPAQTITKDDYARAVSFIAQNLNGKKSFQYERVTVLVSR